MTLSNQAPDTSQAHASLAMLWPANHKFNAVTILGVTDPDGDPITIRIDQIMQNEPTEGGGDGNSCPGATGVGTDTAQLRAERSGGGNGRTYTIIFTALDGQGGSTQSSVTVCVPHNNGGTCAGGGPSFDSTSCAP